MLIVSKYEDILNDELRLAKSMADARISVFGEDAIVSDDFYEEDGTFDEEAFEDEVIQYMMESAIPEFKWFIRESGYGGEIKLARCVNLNGKLNKESLGKCWTTPEYFYEYARDNLDRKNLYCMFGTTSSDNIDWETTAELWGEFYEISDEYELRVIDDTKVHLTDIKKVVDGKLVDLTKEDYNEIMD